MTEDQSQQVDRIDVWNDSRIKRESSTINEKTYGYLLAEPVGGSSRSVLLIHGFPDLSVGWRFQIPLFLRAGFRVICPDCIGYGRSDAPSSINSCTFKSHADDFFALCRVVLGCETILVGGHDWGAAITYHLALSYPSFVTHVFTLVLPYIPPPPTFVPTEILAKKFPSLKYQLQLGSEDGIIEAFTNGSKDKVRAFLNVCFEGKTMEGKLAYSPENGIDLISLENESVRPTRLMSETEMQFYVEEVANKGLRGPCNYYRNRYQNFLNEQSLQSSKNTSSISCPALFIRASDDDIVTREMGVPMERKIPNLTVKEIQAGHWLHWERPEEVNKVLIEWLKSERLIK